MGDLIDLHPDLCVLCVSAVGVGPPSKRKALHPWGRRASPRYHPAWQGRTEGGAEGIRTPRLLNAIEALYQMSYSPRNASPARSKQVTGATGDGYCTSPPRLPGEFSLGRSLWAPPPGSHLVVARANPQDGAEALKRPRQPSQSTWPATGLLPGSLQGWPTAPVRRRSIWLVELRGLEPLTSSVRLTRSTS